MEKIYSNRNHNSVCICMELLYHIKWWHFLHPLHLFTPARARYHRIKGVCCPTPLHAAAVTKVVKYLEACNRLFEWGILGHVYIWKYPNHILNNVEVYSFFSQWLNLLLENGKFIRFGPTFIHDFSLLHLSPLQSLHESESSVTDPTSNMFLSWQTWNLMRITWYGFKEFCEYFNSIQGMLYTLHDWMAVQLKWFSVYSYSLLVATSLQQTVTSRANFITRYGVHGQLVNNTQMLTGMPLCNGTKNGEVVTIMKCHSKLFWNYYHSVCTCISSTFSKFWFLM